MLKPLSAIPANTLAARVHNFGGPENIIVEEVPTPSPAGGQVLVQVEAAGVGPWDGWIRGGNSVLTQPLPLTLGSDLSGIVVAVGPDVSDFKVGDAIYGVTNKRFTDAYAHYAIAQADMIAIKPDSLDAVEAASIPVIAVTAWQGLFDHGHVRNGHTVLIHGGAGGVGAYAIQFAKKAGARVITTASADDAAYVRTLGADVVIDYNNERFEDIAKDVDAVIDLVGGDTQTRSFTVLKKGGWLISAVSAPDQEAAKQYGVTAMFFLVDVTSTVLSAIAKQIDAGGITTKVGPVYQLNDVREVHEILEGKRPRPGGKIVIAMSPQSEAAR
ncbi:NADP-dependent oxidoreductase [Pseudomonas sp.]|jgi:NADPH:quinone reductase-like Zn-dependent oxidoreductase|uniref:NADP-dependent oxidoreductase n=1 Tax=Pseudomonas sp. TaxID=306 RepID=UPI003266DD82